MGRNWCRSLGKLVATQRSSKRGVLREDLGTLSVRILQVLGFCVWRAPREPTLSGPGGLQGG